MVNTPSFQDLLDDFSDDIFVGRSEQLKLFEKALTAARPPFLIMAVSGQGGVGKSTLLEQFRHIADEQDALSALVNEDQMTVIEVLDRMAEQFKRVGYPFKTFEERYKKYRTLKDQVEADAQAPKGFLDFAARSVARIGLRSLRRVPIAGDAAAVLLSPEAEDRVAEETSAFAAYVAQKFTNKDERVLLLETDKELTGYFLTDLDDVAEEQLVVLLFDTFEKTGLSLDAWLRDLVSGKFGALSGKIRFVIAGRYPLGQAWTRFRHAIQQVDLEPFTEAEARDYLKRADITDEKAVEQYLHLSNRLPVLLALLISAPGKMPSELSATAVERFLQGLASEDREAALSTSLPRFFNRDILAAILGAEQGALVFTWLSEAHFVRQGTTGWTYHDVVRSMLLRYLHLRSGEQYKITHLKLAEYYQKLAIDLQLPETKQRSNKVWRDYELERLYHTLSATPSQSIVDTLNALLLNLLNDRLPKIDSEDFKATSSRFMSLITQVFEESGDDALKFWAEKLKACLGATEPQSLKPLQALRSLFLALGSLEQLNNQTRSIAYLMLAQAQQEDIDAVSALASIDKAIVLFPDNDLYYQLRGKKYRQIKNYQVALIDFTKAIELQLHKWDNYYWRGLTYQEMKAYETALADFTKAIDLQPEDGHNYRSRGLIHQEMKAYETALADFTKAIDLQPEDGNNYYWRGRTYREMKAYETALADFTKAIELQPEDGNNYYWRGRTYREMKAYETALADFTKAIELQPADGDNYWGRGCTYRNMKAYDSALVDFNTAIQLQPDDAYNYAARGSVYLLSEDAQTAESDFNKVLELLKQNGRPALKVAEAYAYIEQAENACIWLRRAFERNAKLVTEVQTNTDFDPIRHEPVFAALSAEFTT